MHRPRLPAARLLLAGLVLLAAARLLEVDPADSQGARPPIRVTGGQLDDAGRAFLARAGRAPDGDERRALAEAEIDDEVLYREALERGLDRDDPVVQRRLLTNMAFVAGDDSSRADVDPAPYGDALALGMDRSDVVVRRRLIARMRALLEQDALVTTPSEAELESALERNRERFALPARVRLAHVVTVPGASVPAARPTQLPLQNERDLARLFGPAFARAVLALPTGRWSGPIESLHGEHLVWVYERAPERTAELAAVRNQVRALVLRGRADDAVRQALRELRRRYEVTVDDAAQAVSG